MVSVVIPVYNVEKFLPQCIESVIKQTYSDLQIILVDDGSNDNSGVICDEYAECDKRITVIHQKNQGLSAARNQAIEYANGEYITFVDSDDFILPDMIMNMCEIAKRENADLVECSYMRCLSNDSMLTVEVGKQVNTVACFEGTEKMSKYLIDNEIETMAWAKLYDRKLLAEVRYPVGKYHEDVFTTYKLVHLAKRVATTSQVGYIYRRNDKSIMSESFSIKRLDIIEGKLEQAKFIEKNYPNLVTGAYCGIIYACNVCLREMGKCRYKDDKIEKWLQKLYRKYGRYYCFSNVSKLGKVYTVMSMINVGIVKKMGMLFK